MLLLSLDSQKLSLVLDSLNSEPLSTGMMKFLFCKTTHYSLTGIYHFLPNVPKDRNSWPVHLIVTILRSAVKATDQAILHRPSITWYNLDFPLLEKEITGEIVMYTIVGL